MATAQTIDGKYLKWESGKTVYMITRTISILLVLLLVSLTFSCSRVRKSVPLTSNLRWDYIDETNSLLAWKDKAIIGPGSITLKCGRNYAYGYCHKDNSSLLFVIDLKSGYVTKNPPISDIIYKYKVNLSNEVLYTQTEIFGDCKSERALEILKEDIKNANGE